MAAAILAVSLATSALALEPSPRPNATHQDIVRSTISESVAVGRPAAGFELERLLAPGAAGTIRAIQHAPMSLRPLTRSAQAAPLTGRGDQLSSIIDAIDPSTGVAPPVPLASRPEELKALTRPAPLGPPDPANTTAPGLPAQRESAPRAAAYQPPAAQPAAPTPALGAEALDAMLAQRLEAPDLLSQSRLGKEQREAVKQYYLARSGKPLWIEGGGWSVAARAVIGQLERAYEDGLEPTDYVVPSIAILPPAQPEAALAEADIKLSVAAVLYARDAAGGRLDLRKVSALITPTLALPEPAQVLDALTSAGDAGRVLAGYNPPLAGYQALKRKLADMQATRSPQQPQVRVPPGKTLRVGMRDPRVPLVRVRFALSPADDQLYDEQVAAAVAKFQQENGLHANGVLNRQTLLAMAGGDIPSAGNTSDIIVNMERWRWLPRDLGADYIFVSIPEYMVRVVKSGTIAYEARVIVGKPESPTPVFSHTMQYAIVNPSWFVPPSILKKEFLPGLARDPHYAAKRGYEVVRRGGNLYVRQPPGERNALGHIKFMFPNDHAVYLHDTPQRALFGSGSRAFSHGCVRVDKPMRFAELVLGGAWTEAKIKSMVGRGERTINLQQPLPIHLTYFTTAVDDSGKLLARDDIYGYDRRMKAALGLTRR
ncbi:L,D-transpeptidase family protein [Chelatococcus reniformis]|nr:L,D-transpeptidase family protein [Chelatococcus reniformis]